MEAIERASPARRDQWGESGTRNLATEYRELMAQNGDLDILLVRCRADPDDVEQLSNEQEGD